MWARIQKFTSERDESFPDGDPQKAMDHLSKALSQEPEGSPKTGQF